MATEFKNKMREVMRRAWMLVKVYGFSMAEALKQSWLVLKLKSALKKGVVKFFYMKLDGSIRTAWGTLKTELIPQSAGLDKRKKNDSLITYFDQEKASFRSCKIANLIKIS